MIDDLIRSYGYENYRQYLRSEHWQCQLAAYKADKCFCCGGRNRLTLHHITYKRLTQELPQDFVTVCGVCHRRIHELARGGADLEGAHFVVAKAVAKEARKAVWNPLERSVNKSIGQTVDDLVSGLEARKLMQGGVPTTRAITRGAAKRDGDSVLWNSKRLASLFRSERRIWKGLAKGLEPTAKELSHAMLERSHFDCDTSRRI